MASACRRPTNGESRHRNNARPRPSRAAPRAPGPPSKVGRWTHAPFQIPHAAINAATLPTGRGAVLGEFVPERASQPRQRGPLGSIEGLRKQRVHRGPAASHRPGRRPAPRRGIERPSSAPGCRCWPAGRSWSPAATWSGQTSTSDDAVHGLRGPQPRLHLQPLDPEVEGTAPDELRPLVPGAGRACRWPDGDSRRISPTRRPAASSATISRSSRPPASLAGSARWPSQPSAERKTALYPHLITLPDSNVLLAGPGRYGLRAPADHGFHLDRIPPPPPGPDRRQRGAQPRPGMRVPGRSPRSGAMTSRSRTPSGTHHATASTATLDALHPWLRGVEERPVAEPPALLPEHGPAAGWLHGDPGRRHR